jgi:hypothetical protein
MLPLTLSALSLTKQRRAYHSPRSIMIVLLLLAVLSTVACIMNACVYHFPGNHYFPPNTLFIIIALALMYLGCFLLFGRQGRLTQMIQEVMFFFLVTAALVAATNAVQYTPFDPIDPVIIAAESGLPLPMDHLMAWGHTHPRIHQYLEAVYLSLTYQMTYFPLVIIALRRTAVIRDYYFLLLVTALMGFTFYYFFPTTAPASMLSNPYFSELQKATGLKFYQIHHYIQPTTLEGGMVAFPSFHVIWAWLCVYLLRDWPVAFFFMLVINLTLVASCVILGWHYPLDVLGSVLVILAGHALSAYGKRHQCRLTPRLNDNLPQPSALRPFDVPAADIEG